MLSLDELADYLPSVICFNTKQVARFLNTSDDDVKTMCKSHQLEAIKKGRDWRIPRKAVVEYIIERVNREVDG